jgi:hypothetical protein
MSTNMEFGLLAVAILGLLFWYGKGKAEERARADARAELERIRIAAAQAASTSYAEPPGSVVIRGEPTTVSSTQGGPLQIMYDDSPGSRTKEEWAQDLAEMVATGRQVA